MKSFAKAFRAVLSIALVLCMVMSFVTVSADGTAVTVAGNTPSRLEDGYYTVTYTVSNITPAEDADATIMVYSGDSISKETIKYANQADAASGTATFTMEVPAGVYTVVAGGTGATKGETTLTANTAPAFAEDTATASIDDTAATEAGVVVMAAPVAADADGAEGLVYTLTENDNFELVGGNIVTKAAVAAGTYELTLSVSDGIASDSIAITVTVNKTDVTISAFDDVTAKEVDYGTAKENIGLPVTVTAGEVEFDVTEWTGEYNAEVAGDYTLTATVAAKAGYNIAGAAAPTIKVTVKKAQISAFDAIGPKAVAYNTSKEDVIATLPTEVAAGAYKFAVSAWDSANYDATVPGEYTFTATVVENANYAVAAGVVPTITVTVGEKPDVKVTITGYEIGAETITYGNPKGYALPSEITALVTGYGEDDKITVNVSSWDKPLNVEEIGTETYTAIVEVPVKDGYEFEVSPDAVAEITVTVDPAAITSVNDIPKKYVSIDEKYDNIYGTLPKAVVEYNGTTVEVDVTWPEEAKIPASPGEEETITGSLKLPEYLENPDGLTASLTIKTYNKTFTYKVDGLDTNEYISLLGESIAVDVTYDDFGQGAKYAYVVTARDVEAVAPAVEEYSDSSSLNVVIDKAEKDSMWDVTIFVKVGDYVISDVLQVLTTNTTFNGMIYVNATEDKPTYSAVRVNKAAGMNLTHDFVNFNNSEYDFSKGTFTYTIEKDGEVLKTNTTGEFKPEELADLNGAYVVKVAYSEEGKVLREASRTTNITNIALWYTDLTVNNKPGAVVANKNKKLIHKFTLSDLGANGEAYVGSELAGYGVAPDAKVELAKTTSTVVENELDLTDENVGTYTLYALAKLTEGQSFFDLAIGRTVYLQNSLSTVCNVKLNGSNHSVPTDIAAGLTIEPVWGGTPIEGTTYTAQFYKLEGTEYVPVGEEVSFDDTYELENIDGLTFKSKVVVNVIIDEEVDKTVEKIFYVVK